ncbi:MAG TPA: DUF1697 domain-containing protein [Caulobacteraceae bacterium]|jgi:uncharacterized protein (DUF1697 family)|nr:DUF1697 domain-containing protein [Caulobacteraceae bacterium]
MALRIALLRGVNLGANRRVAMTDVRRVIAEAGFGEVRSLLQSGNLVFEGSGADATIEAAVEKALLDGLGLTTEVVVRTPAEWRAMIAANPFTEEAKNDPGRLVAIALKTSPAAEAEAAVNAIEGPERARVIGREAVIYYPDGQADTKAAGARLDKALGARGTARNWNTVLKLADLAGA